MERAKDQSGVDLEERSAVWADWATRHTREISVAGLVVAAVIVAGWIYIRSGEQKILRGEEAFGRAAQTAAGNPEQGRTELGQVVQRYGGSAPGDMALMMLAESYYEDGKFEDGLKALEDAKAKHPAGVMAPAVRMLIGAGYEGTGKPAQAAAAYLEAAKLADLDPIRQQYQAAAARAYATAGDNASAMGIWRELADKATGQLADEARVQLGTLGARPASTPAKAPG